MIRPDNQALEAAFAARRCIRCGAPADAVLVGQDAIWEAVTITAPDGATRRIRKQLQAAIRDISYCHRHASAAASQERGRRCS